MKHILQNAVNDIDPRMHTLPKAESDPVARRQAVSLIVTLIMTALATTVFAVLAKRLDVKSNWLAAAIIFCVYAAGFVLLKFDQGAALGFLTAQAAIIALITGVLTVGQLLFFLGGARLDEVVFAAFNAVCCASNLILAVKAARYFWRLKRTNTQVRPQHFVTGFAAPFFLLWIISRLLIYTFGR